MNTFEDGELRELQLKELEILKEVKRICKKNSITYFLAFGTLLGAVRHKGFIPWDDDIDICMAYPEYLRFEEVCKKDLGKEFFLQTRDSDPKAGLTFNKMRLSNTTLITDILCDRDMNHGIDVDIYPLYNVADGKIAKMLQSMMTAVYMLLQVERVPQNHGNLMSMASRIILFFFRGRLRVKIKNFCHTHMACYEGKKTERKAFLCTNMRSVRTCYSADLFASSIFLQFEDSLFSAPSGYDAYLTQRYGDYMKLPPSNERGAKLEHILKIDTKKSYLEYKGILYCKDSEK